MYGHRSRYKQRLASKLKLKYHSVLSLEFSRTSFGLAIEKSNESHTRAILRDAWFLDTYMQEECLKSTVKESMSSILTSRVYHKQTSVDGVGELEDRTTPCLTEC